MPFLFLLYNDKAKIANNCIKKYKCKLGDLNPKLFWLRLYLFLGLCLGRCLCLVLDLLQSQPFEMLSFGRCIASHRQLKRIEYCNL